MELRSFRQLQFHLQAVPKIILQVATTGDLRVWVLKYRSHSKRTFRPVATGVCFRRLWRDTEASARRITSQSSLGKGGRKTSDGIFVDQSWRDSRMNRTLTGVSSFPLQDYGCALFASKNTLTTHSISSRSNSTPTMGPRGQIVIGASVLLNRHVPTPNEKATATPITDSIHIFVDGAIPGTINMVATKRRKRSVETVAEIQYIQGRTRLPRSSLLLSDGMGACILQF